MLDIKLVRNDPERIKKDLKKRGAEEKIRILESLIEDDRKWRNRKKEIDDLRHRRKKLSKKIGEKKKKDKKAEKEIQKSKKLSEKITEKENELDQLKTMVEKKLKKIPNILHESVPKGESENDNVEIKKWGKPPNFDFEPKIHTELLEEKELLDMDRGAKIAGSDFYYLRGKLAKLDRAIMRFAIDFLEQRGYEFILPPLFVNKEVYKAMLGAKGSMGEASYKIQDKDYWLIPTSEYPLGGLYKDEVFLEENLPKKLCSFSPCFRREGGGHGKYSRGLYRVHQFNKVEQFIYSKPENSWEYHEELQENAEKLYQKLDLAYRVVNVCTGDIGTKAAKKYDIECWMADDKYHETGSNSNCLDYQARDLSIKYREEKGKSPKEHVHTLNNTALATSRTIIAIVEQYQQEDGSIKIPKALQSYMNGQKFIGKDE